MTRSIKTLTDIVTLSIKTQQYDIQDNDTQYDDSQHNHTQYINDAQQNHTLYINDAQHSDTRPSDTQLSNEILDLISKLSTIINESLHKIQVVLR